MYCSRCGARNDDDAKFCEKCGADLSAMPRPNMPAVSPASAPLGPVVAPPPPIPPYAYPPARHRAWWYPIGVWVILSAFFLFLDLAAPPHTVTWSIWPIGILGIFMVGFPLLHLIEARSFRPRPGRP
jgi:hypothetical protein